jgi:hypothetical protein
MILSEIHLIEDSYPTKYTLRATDAFENRVPDCHFYLVAPADAIVKISKKVTFLPWTAIG